MKEDKCMKINVIIIDKKGKDQLYAPLIEQYKKIAKPFAKVEVIELFDKEIAKAQDISPEASQRGRGGRAYAGSNQIQTQKSGSVSPGSGQSRFYRI